MIKSLHATYLFGLLLLPLLFGCSGIPPVLKPEQAALVRRTDTRAFIPQNELKAEFLRSNYGAGGGLIGAVVDASISSANERHANSRVQVLRNQVSDLDARKMYWQVLSNELASVAWLNMGNFTTVSTTLTPFKAEDLQANAAMNVGTDYYLSQDCRVLVISSGMGFFTQGKPKSPSAAAYAIYYSAEIGEPEGDEAIELWTTNSAATYRKTLNEAIHENVKLVRQAIEFMGNVSTVEQRRATIKARLVHARGDYGIPTGKVHFDGNVLEESADRVIFRTEGGVLYSFPRAEVDLKYLSK